MMTELIDLYPTLADLAGLEAPACLQGTSLKPLLADPASTEWKKDIAFTVSRSGGESIKTNQWRFTQWGFGEKGMELYNLKEDPSEFTNLADKPEYAAVMATLKKRLNVKRNAAGYEAFRRKETERSKTQSRQLPGT